MAFTIIGGIGYDGDFTVAAPASEIRWSRPIPQAPLHVVGRQTFWQLRANWVPQDLHSSGPASPNSEATYLVDETELQDMGGGVVSWDRVWATIPHQWEMPISIVKSYQAGAYSINGSHVVIDASIVSWSAAIEGIVYYDYFSGNPPDVRVVPSLLLIRFSSGAFLLDDLGTGFPRGTVGGVPNLFTSNLAASFISGTLETYMGKIRVRKLIYG